MCVCVCFILHFVSREITKTTKQEETKRKSKIHFENISLQLIKTQRNEYDFGLFSVFFIFFFPSKMHNFIPYFGHLKHLDLFEVIPNQGSTLL